MKLHMCFDSNSKGFDVKANNKLIGFYDGNSNLHIFNFKHKQECEKLLNTFNIKYRIAA